MPSLVMESFGFALRGERLHSPLDTIYPLYDIYLCSNASLWEKVVTGRCGTIYHRVCGLQSSIYRLGRQAIVTVRPRKCRQRPDVQFFLSILFLCTLFSSYIIIYYTNYLHWISHRRGEPVSPRVRDRRDDRRPLELRIHLCKLGQFAR